MIKISKPTTPNIKSYKIKQYRITYLINQSINHIRSAKQNLTLLNGGKCLPMWIIKQFILMEIQIIRWINLNHILIPWRNSIIPFCLPHLIDNNPNNPSNNNNPQNNSQQHFNWWSLIWLTLCIFCVFIEQSHSAWLDRDIKIAIGNGRIYGSWWGCSLLGGSNWRGDVDDGGATSDVCYEDWEVYQLG